MRGLRVMLSSHGLALDYQWKVVKRTLGGGVVGYGGQTVTICGDFGMILGVYVVPDTALARRRPVPPKFDRSDFQSPTIGEHRDKILPGKARPIAVLPSNGPLSSLQVITHRSKFSRQAEVVLLHPLAKDDLWS